jgi:type IV pilus assembly protein PilC
LEITSAVVGNRIYQSIVKQVSDEVRSGVSLSNAFAKHKEIPAMLSQMIRVGEETGMLGQVLKTLGRFYRREVDQAVDTIVALIEPIMIIVLGVGVGVLLVSVLMPIYNMTTGLQ